MNLNRYLGTLLIAALLFFAPACSTAPENSTNTNAPQTDSAQRKDGTTNTNSNIIQNADGQTVAVLPAPIPQATSTTIAPSVAPSADAPKISLPLSKIDFGTQPKGKKVTRFIELKNSGHSPLNIESVSPSCGCTTVDFPKVLAPGKGGRIKVQVDTGQAVGPHTKSVTIKSNDPTQPSVQVELNFTVK